jgi:coenzyme F420-reducing hydrogenase delta subunit
VQTQKRVERMWKKMEQSGLNKERLQLLWASAAEGEKFASKIREMKSIVDKVSPEEVEKGRQVFKKALEAD